MRTFRSRRLEGFAQSEIRRMTRDCIRVGGINLAQGLCDMPAPEIVRSAARDAIAAHKSQYALAEGVSELRTEIARKLERDNGLVVDPEREIVVTAGTTGAFAAALTALLDPGDGVLLLEPYYGYHMGVSAVLDLEVQYLELPAPSFRIDEPALGAAIRPNTRALVVCTPGNPSGRVLDREEIEAIGRVAERHDLLVITDEIYEYFTYDGRQHLSPAAVDGLRHRTVSLFGFSKTFSVTGWRVGFAVAPPEMAEAMVLTNDILYVCAPTPLQHGVAEGLAQAREHLRRVGPEHERKRDLLMGALRDAGMEPVVPEGAYYSLADVSALGFTSSRAAADALLERTGVAAVAGTAFFRGGAGERWLRFCFAKEDHALEEACRRLRRFRP